MSPVPRPLTYAFVAAPSTWASSRPVDDLSETYVVSVPLEFVDKLNKPSRTAPGKEIDAMDSASLVPGAGGDTSAATACWPGRTGTP